MNNNDKKKFAELMAGMGENFQKEISKPMLRIYWMALEKYNFAEVEQAVFRLICTRKITGTVPVVAEIIEAIESKNGTVEERAELAWTKLLWAIEHVGHNKSIEFDDPAIHDTVKALGGWLRVCSADGNIYNEEWFTKNLQWRKKDFLAIYKTIRNPRVKYLIGLDEADNAEKYPDAVPPVVHIGGEPGNLRAISHKKPKQITLDSGEQSLITELTEKLQ